MPRDNIGMYMAHVCFYVCCSDCVTMGLYEVPLLVSLLSFGIGTMLANFHV